MGIFHIDFLVVRVDNQVTLTGFNTVVFQFVFKKIKIDF
jgi:hypothetical protein